MIPLFLLQHEVTVEPLLGHYSQGAMYGEPVTYPNCYVEEKVTLVRDKTGAEVVSSGFIIMPLDAEVPVDSRIRTKRRETTALTVSYFEGGLGIPTPDHLQVYIK